jgi:purine-cytosine permease-like protein
MGGAVPNVPSWTEANNTYSVGGVMYAMAMPVGGFGKFVGVLLAFSVIGITAASIYALSISMALLVPVRFLTRVPRFLFAIAITAIVIPVAIVAATNFYSSLSNFLAIIGYWTAVYCGIGLSEHYYFRNGSYDAYDHDIWNKPNQLPLGVAALLSMTMSFGLIIPCMNEVWYTGPIAHYTGDIGMEVGIVLGVLIYIPLRILEIRIFGR